jgi:hypothetical protein
MEMDIPQKTNFLVEEIYWLSKNEIFNRCLKEFRKTYQIPHHGLKNEDVQAWLEKESPDESINFEHDLMRIAKKCRGYSTNYVADFLNTLRMFFLTNRLNIWSDKVSKALPDIKIERVGRKIKLEILIMSNTRLSDVDRRIRMEKRHIKRLQRSITKTYAIKDAPNFVMNAKVWEMKEKGSDLNEIVEKFQNQMNNDVQNVYKLLARLQKNIENTFN